jgi:predicted nuclease of predicted toxin-antitoxin system
VKLLLDENLSRRLIGQVADLFPGTVHVSSVNLLQASDVEVWEYAKARRGPDAE